MDDRGRCELDGTNAMITPEESCEVPRCGSCKLKDTGECVQTWIGRNVCANFTGRQEEKNKIVE